MKTSSIEMRKRLISSLPLTRALVFRPAELLGKVIETMQRYAQGAALVVEGENLLGIFTERDYLRLCAVENSLLEKPISECMTKKTINLQYNDSLLDALQVMVHQGIRHIPILENDKFSNKILSARDLIDFFAEQSPGETFDGPLPSLDALEED